MPTPDPNAGSSAPSLRSLSADDPAFAPLLKVYLQRLPQAADAIAAAYQAGDRSELCRLVHRIRGTAQNYGFPSITRLAQTCETGLEDAPIPILQIPIPELVALLRAAARSA